MQWILRFPLYFPCFRLTIYDENDCTYLVTENGKTIKYVVKRDNTVGPFRECAEFIVPQRYYEKKDEKRVLRKIYCLFPLTPEVFNSLVRPPVPSEFEAKSWDVAENFNYVPYVWDNKEQKTLVDIMWLLRETTTCAHVGEWVSDMKGCAKQ